MSVAVSAPRPPPPATPAFTGPVAPVSTSGVYQLGLTAVALVMIALPALYLALIAGVAYLGWLHAVYDTSILEAHVRGRAYVLVLLAYFGPIIVAAVAVLFMIKPLFARRPPSPPPLRLEPAQEPTLFAFVGRLCAAVGAPRPREIHVDCNVNASASFRRGLLSLVTGDLVLTVGLPLAAGLTVRQLGGVLAHELGHFAQGAGMRLTFVIRGISQWLARVVYERDVWDVRLVEASRGGTHWSIQAIAGLARGFVWLTRKVLFALMWVGHVVSSFMLRQMELDADRYEARVAGSHTFGETARKLPLLTVASRGAMVDLEQSWSEQRLCDDMPALVLDNLDQIPAATSAALLTEMASQRTGMFDTHPSDKERIDNADREAAPGVLVDEGAASTLFADFGALSRRATVAFYRTTIGERSTRARLVPAAEYLRAQRGESDAARALLRVLRLPQTLELPLRLPPVDTTDADAARRRLEALRAAQLEAEPSLRDLASREHEVRDRLRRGRMVELLHEAHFAQMDPGSFGFTEAEMSSPAGVVGEALTTLGRVQASYDETRALGAERLALGLARRAGSSAAATHELRRVLDALTKVGPSWTALREVASAVSTLAEQVPGNEAHPPLFLVMNGRLERAAKLLQELHGALRDVPYPFDHVAGELSVADYTLEGGPPSDTDRQAVFDATGTVVDRLQLLYVRVVGRLARAAEEAEAELGLAPMKE